MTIGHAYPNSRKEMLTRNTIISALTSLHSSQREPAKPTISSSHVTVGNISRRLGAWTPLQLPSHPTIPVTLWCKRLWSQTSKNSAMWPSAGHLPHRKAPWATGKRATSRSSVGFSQKLDEKGGLDWSGSCPGGLWPRHTLTHKRIFVTYLFYLIQRKKVKKTKLLNDIHTHILKHTQTNLE